MKKSLLLIFALCSFVWLQVEAATTNGTVVNGYYIIQDFDGTAPVYSTTGASVTTPAYPITGQGNSVRLEVTSNNGYFTIPVTLPEGIVLSNNDALVFDLYHQSGTFKRLRVHLGSTHAGSSQVYDFGSNFLGDNLPRNRGTISVNVNQLTGYTTAGNSFRLGFGIDYGTTVIFIDNIRLAYTLSTAPAATDATEITASGFTANWNALFGVENYRLDVATDASFTSMVSGYNNLNVGNVLTYEVTGLDENTTYYYRVRGAKTNGTSPSSSTITVLTESSGPVDLYVAPNLDPVAETDPTPATISVPTVFVIDDYESRSIDEALSVNAPGFTTASVKANPTNGSQKSAYVRVTNWDGYLRLNVQLPVGKVLADYVKLSFDEYLQSGYDQNYKDIRVYFDGVQEFNVASGGTTTNAWTTREFNLAGKTAGNTFVLDIGMRTPNGSYFIDNVKLSPAPAPTATTATAATHIYATSFKAQWSLFQGSTAYFLDVATNNTFTNMVSGYNNLNVGDVANYVVTGLTPGITYYYRVRGTNTSTQSNTITVATKAGTTAASHFATRASGNISDIATWQSSTNNAAWMNATAAPTGDAKSIRVLKGHQLTVDDDFSGAEIIVRAGGQLSVAAGKELELSGRLFLESNEADGTATFINEGTLTVPANNAIVKQYLTSKTRPVPVGETPASNDDWWYISSPVTGATSAVFDPASTAETRNRIGYFNEVTQLYPQILTNDVALTSGKGYLAKLGANATVSFEGALNNGDVNVDITRTGTSVAKRGFNLVGNPYPSYLNWNMVRGSRTDISTGIWYRTRNEGGEMVFDTYNGLSG
ncbi:MAG: fibronectin type III domain-containing protein, partial [Paludibacter sp.]|nr:fibronectin type III domain-containing protein [Paludibacter sp.]